MKKMMTATLMALALQSPAMAQLSFSSGLSANQVSNAVIKVIEMCKRDAIEKKGNIQGSEISKEILSTIPPEIQTDKNKKQDYITFVGNAYVACMTTHFK
jgi:hypothetical protein